MLNICPTDTSACTGRASVVFLELRHEMVVVRPISRCSMLFYPEFGTAVVGAVFVSLGKRRLAATKTLLDFQFQCPKPSDPIRRSLIQQSLLCRTFQYPVSTPLCWAAPTSQDSN